MKTIPADLLKPYYRATAAYERLASTAQQTADRRAQALRAVSDQGYSYGDIAQAIGLSRGMVQKLVERARRTANVAGNS